MKLLKKENKKKNNTRKQIKVESTQSNIPIRDIVNGIIVTTNNEYVKVIEVLPTPFFLKKTSDQNKIIASFISLLNVTPTQIQLKSLAIKSDISKQLEILEKDQETETNESCVQIGNEYRETLIASQERSISRRFFLILKYDNYLSLFQNGFKKSFEEICGELDDIAQRAANILADCGNDVTNPSMFDPDQNHMEILYTLLNRSVYDTYPLEERQLEIYEKYKDAGYIPPQEIIAPKSIEFHPNYTKINDMYYKYLFIASNGYMRTVVPGWIDIFVNSERGVDVDIFLRREDSKKMDYLLRRSYAGAVNDYSESSTNSQSSRNAKTSAMASNYLLDGINEDEQSFYYASTIITVCDENIDVLNTKAKNIIQKAAAKRIQVYELKAQAEEAFNATLPLCMLSNDLFSKTKRNMLTEGAASFYPYTSYEINDKDGIYFGADMDTGAMAIIDIFNTTRFDSCNIFLTGMTGRGKTYTMSLLAIRSRLKHMPIMLISPAKADEYRRLCQALGGTFISICEGSPNVINIMDIFMEDEKEKLANEEFNGGAKNESLMLKKVKSVHGLFQLLYPTITREESVYLDNMIIKTYNEFGITADNESIWNKEHTAYKTMPTLNDLSRLMNEDGTFKSLSSLVGYLTKGSASFFAGQTNIDLNNDFIVFALDECSEELLPAAIYLAMDFCWSKIKENKRRKKMLMIDEWWKMAANKVAASYTMDIAKTIRAYRGSLCIATQQMSDIGLYDEGQYGQAVINNCLIKILMGMDLNATDKIIGLSESERNSILGFKRGQALFIAKDTRMRIKFESSETENRLITTDSAQIDKYIEEENRKKQENLEYLRLQNAKILDTYLLRTNQYSDLDILTSSEYYESEINNNAH